MLCAEVARIGGKTQLWPHSANVVHMDAHTPGAIKKITVAAQSTGKHWARRFGSDRVRVDAHAILPDAPLRAEPFDESQPLHVVVFAGAHFLRRVPLMNYRGHVETWSQTLDIFADHPAVCVIKHKSVWETKEWIAEHASDPSKLRFNTLHANKIRLANMVFASISATSTAILEGIARGIPGIVIRDVPIDETPYYDPAFVPCVASAELGTKAAYETLQSRQRIWFDAETGP